MLQLPKGRIATTADERSGDARSASRAFIPLPNHPLRVYIQYRGASWQACGAKQAGRGRAGNSRKFADASVPLSSASEDQDSCCRMRDSLHLSLHLLPLATVFECWMTLVAVGRARERGKWPAGEAFNSSIFDNLTVLPLLGRLFVISLALALSHSPRKKNSQLNTRTLPLSIAGALTTRSSPPRPSR